MSVLAKTKVREILASNLKNKETNLLEILLEIQEASGQNYVSKEWAYIVAEALRLPVAKVYDVLTFYDMFSTEPRGKYLIEICKSAPCNLDKKKEIIAAFESDLGIKMGETTPDGLFTLKFTSCMGACEIGPVAKIGVEMFGNLTKERIAEVINRYREVATCHSQIV